MQALIDEQGSSRYRHTHASRLSHAQAYLASYSHLTISIITRYEILRGLAAKKATAQLARFQVMCQSLEVLQITDAIIVRAANIYGELYQKGQSIGDADILIAATCLENGCEIVTNNTTHFTRITRLVVRNWLIS